MPFDPGQILLALYPFTDRSIAKIRPVLVVSHVQFNRGEDFVVVPMSSRLDPADPFGYAISDTEEFFPDTQLRRPSTVKWTKVMTISSAVVQRKLGVVPQSVLSDIQGKIRGIFT